MKNQTDNVTTINSRHTNVDEFFENLDGGVFKQKLSVLLSDVAAGAFDHKKKGSITIKLEIERIDGSEDIVKLTHDLQHKTPTMYGHKTETNKKDSTMFISTGGKLSAVPHDNQKTLL